MDRRPDHDVKSHRLTVGYAVPLPRLRGGTPTRIGLTRPCRPIIWFIRSLTAEHLLRTSASCRVRSAGTEPSARVQIRAADIEWADLVYAMEQTHVERLRDRRPRVRLRHPGV